LPVKFALQLKFYTPDGSERYKPKCTIKKIIDNIDDAVDDAKRYYS
jgi:hypothetical protein